MLINPTADRQVSAPPGRGPCWSQERVARRSSKPILYPCQTARGARLCAQRSRCVSKQKGHEDETRRLRTQELNSPDLRSPPIRFDFADTSAPQRSVKKPTRKRDGNSIARSSNPYSIFRRTDCCCAQAYPRLRLVCVIPRGRGLTPAAAGRLVYILSSLRNTSQPLVPAANTTLIIRFRVC